MNACQLANIHCMQIFTLQQFLKRKMHRKPQKNEINSAFLASRKGFEPPTPALGERCSIQLSYRDIFIFIQEIFKIGKRTICRLGSERSIQLSY